MNNQEKAAEIVNTYLLTETIPTGKLMKIETAIAAALTEAVEAERAISEGRLKELQRLELSNRTEWTRAEVAEGTILRNWLSKATTHPAVKTPRVVFSVAFPGEDFDKVEEAAERQGVKVSQFIRDAALFMARMTPEQTEGVETWTNGRDAIVTLK